jgi:hypothetical protein
VLPRELGGRHAHLLHAPLEGRRDRQAGQRRAGEGDDPADAKQDGTGADLRDVELKLRLLSLAVIHRDRP